MAGDERLSDALSGAAHGDVVPTPTLALEGQNRAYALLKAVGEAPDTAGAFADSSDWVRGFVAVAVEPAALFTDLSSTAGVTLFTESEGVSGRSVVLGRSEVESKETLAGLLVSQAVKHYLVMR